MSGMHFERMASTYADARPPYPDVVFETLQAEGVIGPGTRVLEVGAGAGLATREVVRSGSDVVALEPGTELARLLRESTPEISAIAASLEDAELPGGHVRLGDRGDLDALGDLAVGLPKLHATLRPDGLLAAWRNIFGDQSIETPFRARVAEIVAEREQRNPGPPRQPARPSMDELAAGGWFEPVRSERWPWSIELDAEQIRRLFLSFSDWTAAEAEAAGAAVDELGGRVTEHYQTVLHLLVRSARQAP